MPESERERHIRHWILSARKRLARGETYDHGTDTELEWAEERVRVLLPGIEFNAPALATHQRRK